MTRVINTAIDGVKILEPKRIYDNRGWFGEVLDEKILKDYGFGTNFVQENCSYNYRRHTFRGLHWQDNPAAQAKLCTCIRGTVLDIAVDVRKDSVTFGKYVLVCLDARQPRYVYVPKGFAHGYLTLEDDSIFQYKVDAPYLPAAERGLNPLSLTRAQDPGSESFITWIEKTLLVDDVEHVFIDDRDLSLPYLHEIKPFICESSQ